MSLRAEMTELLAETVEDPECSPSWPVTLQDPEGNTSTDLFGLSTDIAELIDSDTGVGISGRQASVCLVLDTLYSQGFSIPVGVSDPDQKPWLITFDDVNETGEQTFKIFRTSPDRAIGVVVVHVEVYT